MGALALQRGMTRPFRSRAVLNARYDAVSQLGEPGARGSGDEILRISLKDISDVERILARVALRSARPRDLAGLSASLAALPDVAAALDVLVAPLLRDLCARLGERKSTRLNFTH